MSKKAVVVALIVTSISAGIANSESTPKQMHPSELLFKLHPPEINSNSWVLIEVFPATRDISLSAYFLGPYFEKNANLCDATKRAIDRQVGESSPGKEHLTTYRLCLSYFDAQKRGYYYGPSDL